jgi:hypothetical protein
LHLRLQSPAPLAAHSVPEYAKIWDKFGAVESALRRCNDILNSEFYIRTAIYSISQTSANEMKHTQSRMRDQFEKYESLSSAERGAIRRALAGITVSADEIRSMPVNKFTIILIEQTIGLHPQLAPIVESQKDRVLGARRVRLDARGVETFEVLRGLVPATEMMPADRLVQTVLENAANGNNAHRPQRTQRPRKSKTDGGGAVGGAAPALAGLAYCAAVGAADGANEVANALSATVAHAPRGLKFILFTGGTQSCMEFDVRGLISAEYIAKNSLTLDPKNGLNKNFIRRFYTARRLGAGTASDRVRMFAAEGVPSHAAANVPSGAGRLCARAAASGGGDAQIPDTVYGVYVVETFDGKNARVISRGPQLAPVDLRISVTTRPQAYARASWDIVSAKYYDPLAPSTISDYETADRGTSSFATKSAIVAEFVRQLDAQSPTTREKYRALLTGRDSVYAIVHNVILSQVPKINKRNGELMLSYLSKIDGVCEVFSLELANMYDAVGDTEIEKIFASEDAGRKIADLTRQIVTSAADAIDTDGMWTAHGTSLKEYFMQRRLQQ